MSDLQTNQTTDGVGTAVSITGPCTVFFEGEFDGAEVLVEVSRDNVTFHPLTEQPVVDGPVQFTVNILGSYYVRTEQVNSGAATDVSSGTNQ
jgi:hypothetical protein